MNFFIKSERYLLVIFLLFFSIGINFYYAQRGLVYPDSFFHYDSAYHILNGNHPFKDFFSISGPFVDYMQSIFFYFFGINWFSYVLHASILNGVLALFTYFVFLELGLERKYSFLYSAAASLIAYPAIGTPFVDYHAIIFSLFAIYTLILATQSNFFFYWFMLPIIIFISFLSKQIPSAYIALLISAFIIFDLYSRFAIKKIIYLFLGFILSVLLLIFFFYLFKINLNDFIVQYILFPLSIGEKRTQIMETNPISIFFHFKFIFFIVFSLLFLVIKNFLNNKNSINFFIISLVILSTLIFIYSQLQTQNQIMIFFLIPVLLGFFHTYYFKVFDNKFFLIILIIISVVAVGRYHFRYNENRYFLDFKKFENQFSVDGEKLDRTFKGIKWNNPFVYFNNPTEEINLLLETKQFIIKNNLNSENKFFFTNYLFFSALVNQKTPSPIKFYDGVIIPDKSNLYYTYYKNYFSNKIIKSKITKIYNIGLTYHNSEFFSEFFQDKKCIKEKKVNKLFIIYDITSCKLI